MLLRTETEILYKGEVSQDKIINPDSSPIYHSTAYAVTDTHDYDFANGGGKYFYNRTANPNRDGISQVISYLEGGEQTIVCSSGMAAISTVLLSLLKRNDHILFSRAIYGETIELAAGMLEKFGIAVSYADFTDLNEVENAVRSNTKIIYTEVIANPLTYIVDIEKVSLIAKKNGILTVVDSTFTTPFAIKPLKCGADIVVHSLTKYFGGHSDVTGGSITASEEIIKKIKPTYLLLGCCMDPNSAWILQRSVQTMQMRVHAQFTNAAMLAEKLDTIPCVKKVHYPGLKTHPQHELAERTLGGYYGAIISFEVENNREKVDEFIKSLKIIKYLGTLGGIRTSLAHPATAFRGEFTEEELLQMGMHEGLIRISVGAENIDDLAQDIIQALKVFD